MEKNSVAIHWKILLGLGCGIACGLLLNALRDDVARWIGTSGAGHAVVQFAIQLNAFVGDVFLRSLRFISVPIVLFSMLAGFSALNDLSRLGRLATKALGIYLVTTAISISIGLVLANVFQPGQFVDPQVRSWLAKVGGSELPVKLSHAETPSLWNLLLTIVPVNPFRSLVEGQMLQVVFTALMVGLALTLIAPEKAKAVIHVCEGINDALIKIIQLIMRVAPFAAFALLVRVIAPYGFDVLWALAVYVFVVALGVSLMMFGLYPLLVRWIAKVKPGTYLKAIAPAPLMAFSADSSSAALPITMECLEDRLGVPKDISGFVAPIGATVNMDGTALYHGVAALFIAQMHGIDLSLTDQISIVLTATLTSIGAATVAGTGLIMLVVVLQSLGMSHEVVSGGIAVIAGVDRILDMYRTSCNCAGDCMVATVIAATERGKQRQA